MRRAILLGILIAAGGFSVAAASFQGQQRERAKVPDIVKVTENLYVIGGADPANRDTFTGGNTAVFITDAGVVLVDTKLAGWGRAILDKVRSVTNKPVTTIINTHTHNDHSGSNTEFPATVEIVTHENTKANMSKATCAPVTNCDAFKGENAKFLPKKTFKDRMSLFSGRDQIDLYYFGRGHTNGDAWVVFPAVRAMHTGDMFARKYTPFIDVDNSGGSAVELAQTLAKAVATIKNVDTIIPGHSTIMRWNDLSEFAEYYADFLKTVQEGMKARKTVDEVANAYKTPERYKGYGTDPQRVKANAQAIYNELRK